MKYFNIALELDPLSSAALEGMSVRRPLFSVETHCRQCEPAGGSCLACRLSLATFGIEGSSPAFRKQKLKLSSGAPSAAMA